jgi:hypothetical protein
MAARLNDDGPFDAEDRLQRRERLFRRIRRRVGPIGRVREMSPRAEDMAMGVTGVRWHSESRCSRVRIGRVARRHKFSADERDAQGESAEHCRIGAEMPSNADALEARTMRRVTLRIVPFLMVCYFISFLDRVNLGFAALQMVEDLHFSATVFGFGAGIFFVSYFLFEVPSNLLLEKFGARRWIARIMITWGVLAGAMALVTGPRSLYLVRFLLGAAEAGFFPGVILYLTYWFPRSTVPGSSGCSRWRFRSRASRIADLGSAARNRRMVRAAWLAVDVHPRSCAGRPVRPGVPVRPQRPAGRRALARGRRARWLLTKLQAQAGQQRPVDS